MPAFRDITGLRFGRLIALNPYDKAKNGGYRWSCQCDCGNQSIVRLDQLESNGTQSCGCLNDIIGQRFGRLIAIRRYAKPSKWLCQCDCGGQTITSITNLRSGNTQSCGCLKQERLRERRTHGFDRSDPTYSSWANMHTRCRNKTREGYKDYGGRGIKICKRWYKFENFLADMGRRPKSKVLDRINNNGDYKPSNCRWVTQLQSSRNRRSIKGKPWSAARRLAWRESQR